MHKTIQQRGELEGALYFVIESTSKISLKRAHKKCTICEEKDSFYAAFDDPLDSAIKGAPTGKLQDASKDALSDHHKDAEEGAFEVALKGALKLT